MDKRQQAQLQEMMTTMMGASPAAMLKKAQDTARSTMYASWLLTFVSLVIAIFIGFMSYQTAIQLQAGQERLQAVQKEIVIISAEIRKAQK